jgi:hypothetical protein
MKKKYIIILVITVFCNINLLAQISITDTSEYLRDSIIGKKTYYVGKPLSTLIQDLKINITDEGNINSVLGATDTFYTKEIRLILYYPLDKFLIRAFYDSRVIAPTLTIIFQDTLAIPRRYFQKGGLLDFYESWNRNKCNYWGQFLVADLRLTGVD